MRADEVLTVSMTETVHHAISLTAERLAELVGIPLDQLGTFLADHPNWTGLHGPHGEAVERLVDVIDNDEHFDSADERCWHVQPTRAAHSLSAVRSPTARTLADIITAHSGNTYGLLTALADHLQLSLAYVDRDTVEAHVERALTDAEWSAANDQFSALDFDDHVGDHGTLRTDWIETVLEKAGIPGYGYTATGSRTGHDPEQDGAAA